MSYDTGGGGATGPFAPYRVTGGQINGEADAIMSRIDDVKNVSTETKTVHDGLLDSVEGMLVGAAENAAVSLTVTSSAIDDQATYAAACTRHFGDRVDEFNDSKSSRPRAVQILNSEYAALATSTMGVSPVQYPPGASEAERSQADDDYDANVDTARQAAQAELRAEYQDLEQWIEDEGNEIAAMLDRGPNEADILTLWQAGALPSWANMVYPHINFNRVEIDQLPYDLQSLSPDELKKIADGVAIDTLKGYIEAEIELATWEVEGKAAAEYKVMADGTVVMSLLLEAGLGREISVSGAEVDASGGVSTQLELTFGSAQEAQEFLDGLDDAAFDLEWHEATHAPDAVATNVAEYVLDQNVTGFKAGIYGQASGEFDGAIGRGELEGRIDGWYDIVKDEYGLKLSTSVDGELGQEGSGYSGTGSLSGEVILDGDREFDKLKLTGAVSASAANEKFGLNLPNTSTGQGVDVELLVTKDDPGYEQIADAVSSGDMGRAADLAVDSGRVVIRQTSIETLAQEEYGVDAGPIGEIEVNYGATAEHANVVWVRQPGTNYFVPINAGSTE